MRPERPQTYLLSNQSSSLKSWLPKALEAGIDRTAAVQISHDLASTSCGTFPRDASHFIPTFQCCFSSHSNEESSIVNIELNNKNFPIKVNEYAYRVATPTVFASFGIRG